MDEEKETPAPETKPSKEPVKEKKGMPEGLGKALSILTLIFLALAIAGIAYVVGSKKSDEPEETPTPIAEATEEPEESDEDEEASPTPSPTEEPSPTPEAKADLYITEYSFDPTPEKQVEFTVSIGIKNQGDADSGPFYWEWWPTAYDYACRERIDDGIGAGGERTVTCDYEYGGWSNYPTKAVADADDEVDESDEDNNTYTENVVPIH